MGRAGGDKWQGTAPYHRRPLSRRGLKRILLPLTRRRKSGAGRYGDAWAHDRYRRIGRVRGLARLAGARERPPGPGARVDRAGPVPIGLRAVGLDGVPFRRHRRPAGATPPAGGGGRRIAARGRRFWAALPRHAIMALIAVGPVAPPPIAAPGRPLAQPALPSPSPHAPAPWDLSARRGRWERAIYEASEGQGWWVLLVAMVALNVGSCGRRPGGRASPTACSSSRCARGTCADCASGADDLRPVRRPVPPRPSAPRAAWSAPFTPRSRRWWATPASWRPSTPTTSSSRSWPLDPLAGPPARQRPADRLLVFALTRTRPAAAPPSPGRTRSWPLPGGRAAPGAARQGHL